MAERTVLVCDVCGKAAQTTVTLRVNDRSLLKDLCATHVAELVKGTRRPRRGRPKSTAGRAASPRRKRATSRAKSARGGRARTSRRGSAAQAATSAASS